MLEVLQFGAICAALVSIIVQLVQVRGDLDKISARIDLLVKPTEHPVSPDEVLIEAERARCAAMAENEGSHTFSPDIYHAMTKLAIKIRKQR